MAIVTARDEVMEFSPLLGSFDGLFAAGFQLVSQTDDEWVLERLVNQTTERIAIRGSGLTGPPGGASVRGFEVSVANDLGSVVLLSVTGTLGSLEELLNTSAILPLFLLPGADQISGDEAPQDLYGYGGDDFIIGGIEGDTLRGGEGNDVLSLIFGEAFGGPGLDRLVFGSLGEADYAIELFALDPGMDSNPHSGIIRVQGAAANSVQFSGIEHFTVTGGNLAESFILFEGDDVIFARGGDDIVFTQGGNDFVAGGLGDDQLDGGEGIDTLSYANASGSVMVDLQLEVASGAGGNDVIFNFEKVEGSDFDDVISGNALANMLSGGEGDDRLFGLAGNDTFYFGAAYTSADEVDAGDGNDSIILQGDYSGGVTIGTITGLESISLAPGDITSFGDPGTNLYDYDLSTTDANVAAGSFLKVNGFLLRAGEDFTFDGSAETDGTFTLFAGKGVDTLTGGAKNDFFLFGQDGRFSAGDTIVGGAGYDSFYLRGDYTIDFNAPGLTNSFSEIESITLASATDSQFFSGGDSEFDYSLTWNDALLASGQTITINGSRLLSSESMTFIGTSELGGHFRIFAGTGDDDLRGGTGNDLIVGGRGLDNMFGGGGNDVFRYDNVLDSTSSGRDGIQDFSLGDKIDLSRIDAKSGTAANDAFTFIGSGLFAGTGASSAGQLRAENVAGSIWQIQGDTDGDGVADLEFFVLVTDADPITTTDFFL